MLNVRGRRDGTVEIATGQKEAAHPKIDWARMLCDRPPERRITIRLKVPAGSIPKYAWKKDEELIAEAKKLIRKSKMAGNPITGRQEFERAYGRLYQELSRRNILDKIGLEKKDRRGKYKSMGNGKLVAEAVRQVNEKGIENLRELCRKCRYLYNHLGSRGLLDSEQLAHLRKKALPQT